MKYHFFIILIVLVLGIWLSGILGIFQFPNAVLYDYYVSLSPEISTTDSDILLIEADEDYKNRGDEIWLNLLETLEEMEAEQILFTFLPKNVSSDFYKKSEEYSNVLFGRKIVSDQYKSGLEALPEVSGRENIRFGMHTVPPAYHGIHRYQYNYISINGNIYPSLESAAVKSIPDISAQSLFMINFNGKFNGIPKISLKRVLSGDIVPELVKGKHVLTGFKKSSCDPGFHTPLTPFNGMSMLDFHAHALDTLLSDKLIKKIDKGLSLVMIVIPFFLGLLFYQFMSIRLFSIFFIPAALLYASIAWIFFSYFYIQIPIIEILSAHLIVFIILALRRILSHEKIANKIFLEASVKLRESVLPESFYDSDEYWTQIINMVNQTLELNRAIFLEAVKDDHRVREIKALNCSLSDIGERRRDYQRTPYSTAIDENAPVKMEKKLFLKKTKVDEDQYLVPLVFGGRVLGFWAFGIESEKAEKILNFHSIIGDFASQISELLYRREHKRMENIAENKGLLNYLSMERSVSALEGLNNAIIILEQRFFMLESVFNRANTSIILYNMFGQLLHVNRNLLELMTNSGFLPYKMTAADFVNAVTNLKSGEVQHLFRRLLFYHESVSLPASISSGHKNYMLHIRPLMYDKNTGPAEEVYPFQTYGILFELMEISELKMFNQMRDELFDNIDYHFRRDFEPVLLGCSILEEREAAEDQRKRVFKILYKRIDKILKLIQHMGDELLKDIFAEKIDTYPVDPKSPVHIAVKALKSEAEAKRIEFKIVMPDSVGMVCAGPEKMIDVIKAVLGVLIKDALDNTLIKIDLIEANEEIIYIFSNTGFGMPNKIFQSYVFEDTEAASSEFKKLRSAVRQIQQWGGQVRAENELGVGIQFRIHLESGFYMK